MDTHSSKEQRGPGWAILFLILGLFALADYFFKSTHAVHDILRGIGFLLAIPQIYLHPPRYTRLATASEFKLRLQSPVFWLAILGIALLLAGLAGEWL